MSSAIGYQHGNFYNGVNALRSGSFVSNQVQYPLVSWKYQGKLYTFRYTFSAKSMYVDYLIVASIVDWYSATVCKVDPNH